ncbi:MAG: cadherin repeat domain-containing protein, partial [Ekhidna sp.]|nr:cadherin repeat domain-containing protein [Ekhidna sp.]
MTATATITVTVTDVNDEAPEITSANSASVSENSTAVLTVEADDADGTGEATMYSISGGLDDNKFNLDASSGALAFKTEPDFEAQASVGGNNTYWVAVTASDGTNTSDPQTITVTVTDVDEATDPANTAPAISAQTFTVAENA